MEITLNYSMFAGELVPKRQIPRYYVNRFTVAAKPSENIDDWMKPKGTNFFSLFALL